MLDKKIIQIPLLLIVFAFVGGCSQSENSNNIVYGDISFDNTGSSEAQAAFLTGVKSLHNFQFEDARIAFEEAAEIDSKFAMAYWGQAMSNNYPLWARQNTANAKSALNTLSSSLEGRLNLANTEKEKAFINAVEKLFFSSDDKLERDISYSNAMANMHDKWPDDHEISIFYALSLLGTVRPGDDGFKRQALAASIAMSVLNENKTHPGAAHFTIHSLDDPEHAILALPAADVYADIAPSSAHALHMPSHIFLQLGMWERVVNSNIEAYASAVSHTKKLIESGATSLGASTIGGEDFHTLSWLAYANLMLGHYDRAEENLGMALQTVTQNPESERAKNGYLNMLARHAIETADCSNIYLGDPGTREGKHTAFITAAGMCAAIDRDMGTASLASERLKDQEKKAEEAGKSYNALQIKILSKEVDALTRLADGDYNSAIRLAKEAADIELNNMSAPSGPPVPMKPASELYGEMLAAAGKYDEAVIAYKRSLDWVPNRTPSIVGLIAAASGNDDASLAEEMRAKIRSTPGINLDQFSAFLENSLANNIN
jgi:tetratricopeptide (TPR) repeat protein